MTSHNYSLSATSYRTEPVGRPECGRRDLHNPEKWSVAGSSRTGIPMFTTDNFDAARICNTVCPVLESCRDRALGASTKDRPRGIIEGGLYWDDRAQPHNIHEAALKTVGK